MATLRGRLLLHWNSVGPGLGLALAVAVALAVAAIFVPVGATQRLEGRLVGWGMRETEMGSRRQGHVQAGDRTFTVRLPTRHDCRLGDRVVLRRSRLWWGGSLIGASNTPCPKPAS